jgi:hypothetical protein
LYVHNRPGSGASWVVSTGETPPAERVVSVSAGAGYAKSKRRHYYFLSCTRSRWSGKVVPVQQPVGCEWRTRAYRLFPFSFRFRHGSNQVIGLFSPTREDGDCGPFSVLVIHRWHAEVAPWSRSKTVLAGGLVFPKPSTSAGGPGEAPTIRGDVSSPPLAGGEKGEGELIGWCHTFTSHLTSPP